VRHACIVRNLARKAIDAHRPEDRASVRVSLVTFIDVGLVGDRQPGSTGVVGADQGPKLQDNTLAE